MFDTSIYEIFNRLTYASDARIMKFNGQRCHFSPEFLGSRGDICFGFGALQSAHCFVKAVRTCRKHALRGFSSHCLSLMRQNCCAPEGEGFPSETRQTSEVVVSVLLRASLTPYRAESPVPRAEQICSRLPKHCHSEQAY